MIKGQTEAKGNKARRKKWAQEATESKIIGKLIGSY